MSNDLNSCNFIGRLGKDPEAKYMPSGDQITSFSIAVGSQWKGKDGSKQESTEWVNCTAFGKLAEIVSTYVKKGDQIFISGRMKTDKYQDKSGADKYSTKIIADRMQMLGGKKDGDRYEKLEREHLGDADKETGIYRAAPAKTGTSFDSMDDDIPF